VPPVFFGILKKGPFDNSIIHDHRSLVIFCENEDDAEQNDIVESIKKVAEKMKESSSSSDVRFFFARDLGPLATSLRKAIKKKDQYDTAIMVLFNIRDDRRFYISNETDITESNMKEFLAQPGDHLQVTM
jgi:hypothetical protein